MCYKTTPNTLMYQTYEVLNDIIVDVIQQYNTHFLSQNFDFPYFRFNYLLSAVQINIVLVVYIV